MLVFAALVEAHAPNSQALVTLVILVILVAVLSYEWILE